MDNPLVVFTKPWKRPLAELGELVSGLGFAGVELPVRPGYQVPPERVEELPRAAAILRDYGLRIESVAGPTDESTIAACSGAGVRLIRICMGIRRDETYTEGELRIGRELERLLPALEQHGVAIGVQNHCGRDIANACGLRALIGRFDPSRICAVWDAAHCALQGEEPELALDIVGSHLRMVNLKNAFWKRVHGPEAPFADWRPYWTTGRHGLASWPRVVEALRARLFCGPICLTAEYDDTESVDRLIAEDVAFAKSLLTADRGTRQDHA